MYCNKYACDNIGGIYCDSCKFTPYCSNYCRIKDLPGHSLICSHSMRTRIVNYNRVLQSRFDIYSISINATIMIDNKSYAMNVFGNGNRCAVCYVHIRSNNTTTNSKMVLFDNINYDICMSCSEKKLVLCKNTALDSRKCGNERALWSKRIMLFKFMHDDIISDIMYHMSAIVVQLLKCTENHI